MAGTETMTTAQLRAELGMPAKAGDAAFTPPRLYAHPEDDLQAAFVQWLGYSLRPDVFVHHSPNERRDVVEAKRMKRAGTVPGWPDLEFVWSEPRAAVPDDAEHRAFSRISRVAFLEIKTATGSLTPDQRAFRDWCQESGIPHAVVRTLDEAIAAVTEWGLTKTNTAAVAPRMEER